MNGAYGTEDSVLEQRPSMTRMCLAVASCLRSRTRRLLPTPASPPRRSTVPCPSTARSRRSRRERNGASRPTGVGHTTDRILYDANVYWSPTRNFCHSGVRGKGLRGSSHVFGDARANLGQGWQNAHERQRSAVDEDSPVIQTDLKGPVRPGLELDLDAEVSPEH